MMMLPTEPAKANAPTSAMQPAQREGHPRMAGESSLGLVATAAWLTLLRLRAAGHADTDLLAGVCGEYSPVIRPS